MELDIITRDAYNVCWAEIRIFKVATWHYRCRHNLKNNCIWDDLQCCLLVPRSPTKPVMLTFDLQSRKVLFIEIVFGIYNLERQLWYWHLLTKHCPCNLLSVPTSEILTEIYEFQKLTYFVIWWCHQWRHEYIFIYNCSHNLMIPMHRKFDGDIFARFLVTMKNVVISIIKKYRGPTLRPPCDVFNDVIIMKNILFA